MDDDETAELTTAEADTKEDLTEFIGNVLETCLEDGMQVPLILAAVAVNGSVLVIRYVWSESHEGFDTELLAKHLEDKGFALPINIMVVDSGGEAARVLIGQGGIKYLH